MLDLNKIAALAEYADKNGQYDTANKATQIIREASLFEALRTLFDPGYGMLDRDSSYWKRLQRGWARGKMDRGLGLLMAIHAEKTRINKKIEELAAPLKDFNGKVGVFYDKLMSGANEVNASSLRDEMRELQSGLKETLKLLANKDLRNALKLRERLQEQQVKALEKVKGLDEDTKDYLASVLRGEQPYKSTSIGGESSGRTPLENMKMWLKKQKLQRLPMTAGAQTLQGKHQYREFMTMYGFNPKAVAEYFNDNGNAQAEGFDRYPEVFGEMLRRANQIMMYDDEMARGVHRSQKDKKEVPGEVKQEIIAPTTEQKQGPTKQDKVPPTAKTTSPPEHGLTEDEERLRKEVAEELQNARDQRAREKAQEGWRAWKANQQRKKEIEEAAAKKTQEPKPIQPPKASRTERGIVRLARMRILNKIIN